MNIIFMGNPNFATTSLRKLHQSHHKIIAVVTNPKKRAGRGRAFKETPVSIAAKDAQLKAEEIGNLHSIETFHILKNLNADAFVVVAYRILPKELIRIPKYGAINLHGSLLPKYRGAAPIQRALINGDNSTGLTTFIIEPKIDTGKILMQQSININPDDDYGSLSERMSIAGAELLVETLNKLENGTIIPLPQNDTEASSAPKITPSLTKINWENSAIDIHNLARGLSPFPGVQTTLNSKIIKLYKTQVIHNKSDFKPGVVSGIESDNIVIQTRSDQLSVSEIQLEGKKRMLVSDFLRGYSLEIGTELG
ncbi:MAG: methionyl-tRNA formyltransferase [Fidelibacterota bacterium]